MRFGMGLRLSLIFSRGAGIRTWDSASTAITELHTYYASDGHNQCCGAGPFLTGSSFKKGFQPLKFFLTTFPPSLLEKLNSIISICFLSSLLSMWENIIENFVCFMLGEAGSRSRTFTPAPTKKYRLRNTVDKWFGIQYQECPKSVLL